MLAIPPRAPDGLAAARPHRARCRPRPLNRSPLDGIVVKHAHCAHMHCPRTSACHAGARTLVSLCARSPLARAALGRPDASCAVDADAAHQSQYLSTVSVVSRYSMPPPASIPQAPIRSVGGRVARLKITSSADGSGTRTCISTRPARGNLRIGVGSMSVCAYGSWLWLTCQIALGAHELGAAVLQERIKELSTMGSEWGVTRESWADPRRECARPRNSAKNQSAGRGRDQQRRPVRIRGQRQARDAASFGRDRAVNEAIPRTRQSTRASEVTARGGHSARRAALAAVRVRDWNGTRTFDWPRRACTYHRRQQIDLFSDQRCRRSCANDARAPCGARCGAR